MDMLKINRELKTLDTSTLGDNLLYYEYHTRHLLSLIKSNADRESQQYLSAYNGFKGELYENVVYELLLQYAINNEHITQFVLKGPHQDLSNKNNEKFGLLMDKSQQIVYKAGYKDVSEYDAMFFTNDAVYYVESTIVQSTIGLRKRLRKKTALLSLLFPHLEVRSLAILSDGANGINKFPSNCTVWITNSFDANEILEKLSLGKKYIKTPLQIYNHPKLIEAKDIKVHYFKYFDTLGWILKKAILNNKLINTRFFLSDTVSKYIDVYSKVYIGFVTKETFEECVATNKILGFEIDGLDQYSFFVALEKLDDGAFEINYYIRLSSLKIKKVEITTQGIKISDKDPKGFTVAELKFIKHSMLPSNDLSAAEIQKIKQTISNWK